MAKVICKSTDEIWAILFGKIGSTVFTASKFDFSKFNGRLIDTRVLNLQRYDGFFTNEHHITTASYYKLVLPYLNLHIKTFDFKYDDFVLVPYFTKDYRFNCSYLKPKDDSHRFTISINGVTVARHVKFDALHNAKRKHPDKNVDFGTFSNLRGTEYHKLFRGSHSCCRIINETIDNNKSIFVSGDSMMIPIIPILCCYYKEVVYMDNRDNKSHKDYYEGKVFDTVLLAFYEDTETNKVLDINLK